MTPPQHPADDLLKEYVRDDGPSEETRQSAHLEVRAHFDSAPPPHALTVAQRRGDPRLLKSESGSWNVDAMLAEARASFERIAADRLAEEREKRLKAERALEKIHDGRAEFVRNTVSGIVVAVVVAVLAVLWALAKTVK